MRLEKINTKKDNNSIMLRTYTCTLVINMYITCQPYNYIDVYLENSHVASWNVSSLKHPSMHVWIEALIYRNAGTYMHKYEK